MPNSRRTIVLSIAGSDSGAGAGLQADSRTIQAMGGYVATAVTAVTAQDTRGIRVWKGVPTHLICAQIEAVLSDFDVKAIKTGLLPGASAVLAVSKALSRHTSIPLVVDPVIGSSSGTLFLRGSGVRALRNDLLKIATIVTPNWPEAEQLTGLTVRSAAEAEAAARALLDAGCGAVLVKGGHGVGRTCRDCLATSDGKIQWFESPRISTGNTHGTGCVLSAAIAFGLAQGRPLADCVERAKRFLFSSLRANRAQKWGRGHGPAFPGS